MNKYTAIAIVTIGLALPAFSQSPSPSPTSSPSAAPSSTPPNGGGVHCGKHSRNVLLFSYYGTKDMVAHNMSHLPVNLSERRVFLQITKAANTDIRLFELQPDGSFKITEWSKADASRLLCEIDSALIKNKGENCAGEAVKHLLPSSGKPAGSLPATVSPEDAFVPAVQKASDKSDDFVNGIVIILC